VKQGNEGKLIYKTELAIFIWIFENRLSCADVKVPFASSSFFSKFSVCSNIEEYSVMADTSPVWVAFTNFTYWLAKFSYSSRILSQSLDDEISESMDASSFFVTLQ
jgi:hypothetical protein